MNCARVSDDFGRFVRLAQLLGGIEWLRLRYAERLIQMVNRNKFVEVERMTTACKVALASRSIAGEGKHDQPRQTERGQLLKIANSASGAHNVANVVRKFC